MERIKREEIDPKPPTSCVRCGALGYLTRLSHSALSMMRLGPFCLLYCYRLPGSSIRKKKKKNFTLVIYAYVKRITIENGPLFFSIAVCKCV